MSLYEDVGEAEGVRALVDRFYDLMDELDEAAEVRALHPTDLTTSRQKFTEFLSGWMGGPQLYVAKYGHPRLRARHMPFPIATQARDQWMLCMTQALDELVVDEKTRTSLMSSFARVADHMRNQQG